MITIPPVQEFSLEILFSHSGNGTKRFRKTLAIIIGGKNGVSPFGLSRMVTIYSYLKKLWCGICSIKMVLLDAIWEHGQDVVNQKNEIAFERLRMLIYSDDQNEHTKLGKYGLGTIRTREDYEIFAGMDLRNKKAHPNVFEGINPDPVTIKCEQDWDQCVTFEEYRNFQESHSQSIE